MRAFEDAAASMAVPLRVIRDRVRDGERGYESNLILARPDHFVAWTADTEPADAAAVLARCIALEG